MLTELFSFNCRCVACIKNFPANYENIPEGKIPSPFGDVTDVLTPMLDYDVENLCKFLEILEKFDHQLPCLSLNALQLRVHKAMKLKYGAISTKLLMIFSAYLLHV